MKVRIEKNGKEVLVKPDQSTDSLEIDNALIGLTKQVQNRELELVVLDLEGEENIPNSVLRSITVAAISIRKTGKKMLVRNITPKLKSSINEQGLSDLFSFQKEGGGKGSSVDVEFINAFIDGAMETLKVQCSLETQPGKAVLRKNFDQKYVLDIMGVIGLTSKSFNGSVAICFPEATFLGIMEKMLGEEFEKITEEVRDGAGELLNIIFGMAKVRLNKSDHRIEKAIPSVIHGKEIGLKHITSEAAIVLPFSSAVGVFHIEIGIEIQRG